MKFVISWMRMRWGMFAVHEKWWFLWSKCSFLSAAYIFVAHCDITKATHDTSGCVGGCVSHRETQNSYIEMVAYWYSFEESVCVSSKPIRLCMHADIQFSHLLLKPN